MKPNSDAAALCDARYLADSMELLFREANHRIANSLQTAMALARLAGRAGDAGLNDGGDAVGRLAAIANVHRLLAVSEVSGMLDIETYLGVLFAELRALWSGHQGVRTLSLSCPPRDVSVDVAARIGMIIHELVTNSCKYAYADGRAGEVRTAFFVRDASYVVLVADDGVGWRPDPASPGRGTGQSLMTRMAAQIGGTLRYLPAAVGTTALLTGPAGVFLARDAVRWRRPDAASEAACLSPESSGIRGGCRRLQAPRRSNPLTGHHSD